MKHKKIILPGAISEPEPTCVDYLLSKINPKARISDLIREANFEWNLTPVPFVARRRLVREMLYYGQPDYVTLVFFPHDMFFDRIAPRIESLGYRFAVLPELLQFAIDHPEVQNSHPVASLDYKSKSRHGPYKYPVLTRRTDGRLIEMRVPGKRPWSKATGYLCVRQGEIP
ncbi:MAG: hypothetical protein A2808_03110 [Candidatus Moranbacteria bacterium RIFCSPHIGHO2_01_FULL_55_24]|nr:MAG: hypothetical protein A2808_03110 [Candidatus Moranbacteria bacterium RIFCSPHIGHO2_01_FULL_55_24]